MEGGIAFITGRMLSFSKYRFRYRLRYFFSGPKWRKLLVSVIKTGWDGT